MNFIRLDKNSALNWCVLFGDLQDEEENYLVDVYTIRPIIFLIKTLALISLGVVVLAKKAKSSTYRG